MFAPNIRYSCKRHLFPSGVASSQNQAVEIEYNTHYTIENTLTKMPQRDLLPQNSQGMHKAGSKSYSIRTTSGGVLKRQAHTKPPLNRIQPSPT
jgi:hypothetical protein